MDGFYERIAQSTAHRASREENARIVGIHPPLLPELFAMAYSVSDKNHHKACWVLELFLENDIQLIRPELDSFCRQLSKWKADGAVRSVSKIVLMAAQDHNREANDGRGFLSEQHIGAFTENCFDWLIGEAKVASKAYAMRALLALGKSESWIYHDLKRILSDDFHKHSAGYQSAARAVLKKIR
ncbi:hypothetical protein HYN48_06470 [Flavobacterium magnum]|uniref:Adenylosuccinate lyase n=1 Tax=Flavobacterium magnum TaxID=2162713 RepID=A0A2S0RDZ3_9FLAO|nr:hypothetical protein [Flavobacterium magnum]AWA29749.1 hypothetical protein HYN48_06470 [Flavobacterium magnum]